MSKLHVADIFTSIQGEGVFAGTPAVFLRLQGCNLRCPWCDEPKALSFNAAPASDSADVAAQLIPLIRDIPYLVITGGEPTAQDCGDLLYRIREALGYDFWYDISVETNGTLAPRPWLDRPEVHITLSPKTKAGGKAPHPDMVHQAGEIKLVVEDDTNIQAEYNEYKHWFDDYNEPWFYLMPEDGQKDVVLPKCVAFVMAHPREARVCLRQHKLMNLK